VIVVEIPLTGGSPPVTFPTDNDQTGAIMDWDTFGAAFFVFAFFLLWIVFSALFIDYPA